MRKTTLAALFTATTLAFAPVAGSAATVGDATIDRSLNDGFSNFGFAFTNDTFVNGNITEWSAFAGNAGEIGLLVLDEVAPNQFEIASIDIQTVVAGLNTFTTFIAVSAGQILGLYQGDGKVDYDLISGGTSDQVFSANGALGAAPTVGTTFNGAGSTPREYSINAEVAPVPLPAGLPLMLIGLGALGVAHSRKKAA